MNRAPHTGKAGTPAIIVEGVDKRFRMHGPGRTLKSTVLDALRPSRRAPPFHALRNVSFTVNRGETLGIIGANGAGKSTLLGIVAGTLRPSRGTVRTYGTVASLLELGAGFHPDLTGRENVFLYGAIMGIPRRRMAERFDAVAAFAGIGDFMDQPVKYYSSGMYVRLGFAVAVEVDPDILLVDEVLAVGDAAFQRKCLDKMRAFRNAGKTLLIISHDMHTIRSVSDRILLLDHGEVKGLGTPDEMVSAYQRQDAARLPDAPPRREWGSGEVRVVRTELLRLDNTPATCVPSDEGLRLRLHYSAAQPVAAPVFGFAISDRQGREVHGSNTQIAGFAVPEVAGQGSIEVELPRLGLASGHYLISFAVHSSDHLTHYHRVDHALSFEVENRLTFDGCVEMESHWRIC
ncbi:MAG: ABC transporter ATP-binding protein [Lentisphaerae bacterium]|jgi:ABC-type polysaccharide/polyol phosphate transport system ATPase subunit|nr:ABC transporter ATP-binding protein [Lentisphaerota bacterium]